MWFKLNNTWCEEQRTTKSAHWIKNVSGNVLFPSQIKYYISQTTSSTFHQPINCSISSWKNWKSQFATYVTTSITTLKSMDWKCVTWIKFSHIVKILHQVDKSTLNITFLSVYFLYLVLFLKSKTVLVSIFP